MPAKPMNPCRLRREPSARQRRNPARAFWLLALLCNTGCAGAQAVEVAVPAASAASAAATPAEPAASAPPPAAKPAWDGVIGLTTAYRPRYPGAPRSALRATPGFYLRYGRFTATNASGFAPRRSEDVARGVGVDVLNGERLSASLSLRYDNGRKEGSTDAYAGLGNIRPTARARLAASWDFRGPWRLGASWNADAMGRGNGGVGDISAGWETVLGARTTGSISSSLSFGDAHYMQAYYGITPAQSSRSIYPAYQAKAGWRDAGLSFNLRHDFSDDWVALGNLGTTRLLGSAAGSPITRSRNGWGLGAGIGWRF